LVSASGGETQAITELDANKGEDAHYYPQFLPDGRSFVYFRRRVDRSRSGVYIGRIDDPDRGRNDKLLLTTQHRAVYAPAPGGRSGHLLFVRGSSLFSQPFDPARQELGGQPALLAENVSLISANAYSDVSSSDTGIVAYALGDGTRRVLTKRDRTGKPLGKPLGEPIEFSEVVNARLSHDGRKVVWSRADAHTGDSLWFTDLTRNTTWRFVYDGPVTGAVWSPNDQRIPFEVREGIYAAPADGSGKSEKLYQSSSLSRISDWSRDGRFLLFSEWLKDAQYDLFALPMTAPHKLFPVAQGRSNETFGAFSPDGRWIAFYSDETGRYELYVQGFPEPRGKWMVSTEGATGITTPYWRGDGKELIYWNDGALHAVKVEPAQSGITLSKPAKLFNSLVVTFMATQDAKTFYTIDPPSGAGFRPIVILANWQK
jgi:Tol biopolymer transport system component